MATALYRWISTDMRWNRKELSRLSLLLLLLLLLLLHSVNIIPREFKNYCRRKCKKMSTNLSRCSQWPANCWAVEHYYYYIILCYIIIIIIINHILKYHFIKCNKCNLQCSCFRLTFQITSALYTILEACIQTSGYKWHSKVSTLNLI